MNVYLPGEKVILRDLTPDDVPVIWHWRFEAEDREHEKWNGPYGPVPFESLDDLTVRMEQGLFSETAEGKFRSQLVIEADGKLIGTVNAYWVDERTKWLEIGIVIFDSRYWSGGYGTEAFGLWMTYLFANLDIVRLGISTWSGNERMMRLAAKWGMIEEGRIRRARIVRGDYYDSIKMGILREEWDAREGA
ncbi:GNAT family N-acetyltransferase [Tumebacillus flagellatus]|uniref:GNAT family acetyltransferase n=1 Tax=Tumebacillus flagellatus TaxID=1157490 RepID=A0A074LYW6_9BACL|nr:GNAT family protein [Tumebacillus flagellatus]KEO85238.1 GNAT family acetyltransferase [Tumebacillus flagellatus]